MSDKPHFVLLSENPGLLVQLLYAVYALGPSACIFVIQKEARLFPLTIMAKQCIYSDFHGSDDEYLIEQINRLAQNNSHLTVIPCDCSAERLVDRIARFLNAAIIPAPNAPMLDCFDNKWRFYEFSKKYGLTVPSTQLIASKCDLEWAEVVGKFGLPFVIKPVDQDASLGFHIISSEQEYRNTVLNNDRYQFSPLLVQQYVRGTDIGLNLLSIHGRITAIAVQQRDFPRNPSAPIEFISNPRLESAVQTICKISGYHGVMNIDARIEEETGRVFLFESNPRFWASLSASVWCGLNFLHACIEQAAPSEIRRLHAGRARMHPRPIARPALWGEALFSRHPHRRRMLKLIIMVDLWTVLVKFRSMWRKALKSLRT